MFYLGYGSFLIRERKKERKVRSDGGNRGDTGNVAMVEKGWSMQRYQKGP